MKNILFEGVYSATFSIYDKNMNIIRDSVKRLIDFNTKNGIKGFYVGGGTGECTVLPNETRKQMLEAVKEFAPSDAKIIAHIGAGHLEDTEDLIYHANEIGVDAISSLPPALTSYYNANETVEYYRHLAELSDAPVIAYATPVLTCDPVWFAKEIMSFDNVIGLKVSIRDYYAFEKLKNVNGGDINILNGPDECMMAGLAMGADGAIGTTYNLLPKTSTAIYDNFKKNNIDEARKYQKHMNRLIDRLLGNNLAYWKVPLQLLGIDTGYTVAPAKMPTDEEIKTLLKDLKDMGYAEELKL